MPSITPRPLATVMALIAALVLWSQTVAVPTAAHPLVHGRATLPVLA